MAGTRPWASNWMAAIAWSMAAGGYVVETTLLLDMVRRNAPDAEVATFRFRAVRPTFDLHPFRVNGEPSSDGSVHLWAQDHEGFLTMDATATLR